MFATPTSLLFVSSALLSTFTLSNQCFRFVPHTTIASNTKVANIDTFSDVPFRHTCLMLLVANRTLKGATCMHISDDHDACRLGDQIEFVKYALIICRPIGLPAVHEFLQAFFFSFLGKFWESKEGSKEVLFFQKERGKEPTEVTFSRQPAQ